MIISIVVVPRTFLGPILIAILASPFSNISSDQLIYLQYIGEINLITFYFNFEIIDILVRVILGLLVTSGLTHLYKSLKGYCDLSTRRWWLMVILTQFHLLFYSTRTLPNIFALVIGLSSFIFID